MAGDMSKSKDFYYYAIDIGNEVNGYRADSLNEAIRQSKYVRQFYGERGVWIDDLYTSALDRNKQHRVLVDSFKDKWRS